ncbi:hypothetical protein N7486_008788 [Penicillium sp. IBT 16267x]|nr:hypothetical protein N7486_008788 [Penicillium sp. IBT 16267x]
MPDASMLDDGKDIKFEHWKREISNKLTLNGDHYLSERHRIAYVLSRCTGKAALHTMTRADEESTDRYRTYKEILEHLDTVFRDPQRRRVAQREFTTLMMKPGEDFNSFYAEFARLAMESHREKSLLKEDVYDKVPYKLQTAIMKEAFDDSVALNAFVDVCRTVAIGISRLQPLPPKKDRKPPTDMGLKAPSTPVQRNTTNWSNTTKEERATLMKEGKCFLCKRAGHLSRDCPSKTKAVTQSIQSHETEEPRLIELEATEAGGNQVKDFA